MPKIASQVISWYNETLNIDAPAVLQTPKGRTHLLRRCIMNTLPPHGQNDNSTPTSIPLTKGKYALVDREDADLGSYRWHVSKFYAVRREGDHVYGMHRVILERKLGRAIQSPHVDHINGNYLDNRRENLREATYSQNFANRKPLSANVSSQYKGVSRADDKWLAHVGYQKQIIYLGRFETEDQAAMAYDRAAVELYGEYARTNHDTVQLPLWGAVRNSRTAFHAKNTTGYRGVYRSGKRWRAQIAVGGVLTHLGCFVDPIEAAKAYDKAAIERLGSGAIVNFPLSTKPDAASQGEKGQAQ